MLQSLIWIDYRRYNRLDFLYLNAGIMPNPQFDVGAFFKGLLSRYLTDLTHSEPISQNSTRADFKPHTSTIFSLQSCRHDVSDWRGDSDTEGLCHCGWPAGSLHDQPLWSLPAGWWLLSGLEVWETKTKTCSARESNSSSRYPWWDKYSWYWICASLSNNAH